MQPALEFLSGAKFIFGGVGLTAAIVMVAALLVLMPRGRRHVARLPAVLLGLHVGLVAIIGPPPHEGDVERSLEVAAVFLLLTCVARAGFLLVVDWLLGQRLRRPLPRIFRDVVQVLVYCGVAFLTLRALGAEIGSLLTTSALLTAVVGLSLQETLGNLFAGLAIQAQQPFRIGHWIHVGGMPESAVGEVIEINWRATKIVTNDLVELIIPNGMIAKSPIRNFSEPSPVSRRIVTVQGPYEIPPHRVEAALLEAARGCPGVVARPAPTTWVSVYADSGIEYSLVYFIDDFPRHPAIDALVRRRIWYAMQRAGVSVPFPICDVRMAEDAETRAAAEEERVTRVEQSLRSVYLFSPLSSSAFSRLARAAESRLYAAGEEVIRQGEEGSELFVLVSGAATVLVRQPGKEPVEVAQLEPGDVVGEMSLVTGERRSATVRTSTACECFVVSARVFRSLLKEYPDLAARISEVLATRQAELDSTQPTEEPDDHALRSGMLLDRVRAFFALWPSSVPPPSKKE